MRKILLVIEDYSDLVSLENLLRRLGFDVMSLGKEILLNDALARFTPDAVLANYKSRQVDGVRIATRMKKSHPAVRIALTYTGGSPTLGPEVQAVIDALLALPMQAPSTIRVVAQILDLDAGPLMGKYQKMTSSRAGEAGEFALSDPLSLVNQAENALLVKDAHFTDPAASSNASLSTAAGASWDPARDSGQSAKMRSERSDRYDKFLAKENPGPANAVLPRDLIAAAIKQLKQAAEKEKDLLEQIRVEKQAFANALFVGDKKI